ncbi:hypothetical protein [Actinokineospora sp. HUAS TT18]|uniref:hypothetical protein n=1 Tax=Actinokineospora sp. HUAS TT18 TaxID=3447451 RepID=UPI003F525ECF
MGTALGWREGVSSVGARGDRPVTYPRGTPRQKHNSKITVYVSDEELLALEHARLALRASHGLAVDRGRVVREAVAVILADLQDHGADSVLVRRLRQDDDE